MPFSRKTLDFLFENRLNDSREWYNEHKDIYKEYVTKPFAELLSELAPMFREIDPEMVCAPSRISRVHRDIRFSKDKSLFRDNIWFSVSRRKEQYEQRACFYFSVGQQGFEYGCGYYQTPADVMEELRALVISGDKLYKEASKAMKTQSVFEIGGDAYKRNRYPSESAEKQKWLNMRNIYTYTESRDHELLFSDKLADKLKEDFPVLAPVYKLFIKAEENAKDKRLTLME